MPLWQLADRTILPAPAITTTTVTASATIHTKGAWSQLTAAAPEDVTGIHLVLSGTATSAAVTNVLVDIGIGAAASEIVIVSGLQAGGATTVALGNVGFFLPLRIPNGVRVAARCQALIASDTVICQVAYETDGGGTKPSYAAVDTYGPDTANSRGVLLSQNNTTWTQIVASTTNDIDALLFVPDFYDDTTQTALNAQYQIGVGAAAAEQVVFTSSWRQATTEIQYPMLVADSVPTPCNIPAGSRISIRRTAAYANNQGGQLYGFRR